MADEAVGLLRPVGVGSTQEDEYHRVADAWGTAADEADRLGGVLAEACRDGERYLASLGVTDALPPAAPAAPPRESVQSPSGDHYPVQASWGAHLMDRYSPPGGNVPVCGLARARGSNTTLTFRPSEPYWAQRATERARTLGVQRDFWGAKIVHHVEFEVATWMIESRITEAELVINRTPCGYRTDLEGDRQGCHQYLSGFLPQGFALHLYGTDDNGRKIFITTYRGRNTR